MVHRIGTYIPTQVTAHSQEATTQESQESIEVEQPPPIPLGNKQRKIVVKNVLKVCAECNKYPMPLYCVVCQKPLCTSCKLDFNGTLGRYCCLLHARKTELTFTRNPSGEQAVQQADAVSGTLQSSAESMSPLIEEEPSNSQVEKPSYSQPSQFSESPPLDSFIASDVSKKLPSKKRDEKKKNPLLFDSTDALLHKAVCFDVSSDVGKSIISQLRCSVTASSFRSNTIVGTVVIKVSNRVTSGSIIYEVAWNNSEFGTTEMTHSNICLGMSGDV